MVRWATSPEAAGHGARNVASASFSIDTSELKAVAAKFGDPAQARFRDEMRQGFLAAGNIVRDDANALIKNKSGELAKSAKVNVSVSGGASRSVNANAFSATVQWFAKHADWVNNGRGPIVAKNAKALRFEIDGEIIFRKSVGPAPAQHFAERGLENAKGKIDGALRAALLRFVTWANGGR